MSNADRPHHHGNLRAALIEAGLDILTTQGIRKLTLRACASRAGVSHAAPAHHFRGLDGLIAAIAARGFEMFTNHLTAHRDAASADPRARLIGLSQGYLAFADSHPALLSLIFSDTLERDADPALKPAADAAFIALIDTCAPFEPISPSPYSTEIMVWSLVHGLASLRLGCGIGPPDANAPLPDISDILPDLTLKH